MSKSLSNVPDVLYYADSAPLTQKDIESALISIGINKGDVIMVHSDISSFGKLGASSRNSLLAALLESLKKSVGKNGTIIMPAFTYSFFKNKPYDIKNSNSAVGVLTEYFRNQQDVVRTIQPNHSVAIWGRHNKYLSEIGKDSFDESSIFGKLHKMNGKIVFLGVPFHKSCTFVHYIEQIHGVPYRHIKKFKCRIILEDKEYEDEFSIYYRYSFFFNSMSGLEEHLTKKGLLKEVKVGNGKIAMVECSRLFKEGYKLLDKDAYFLLKKEPFIFKLFNYGMYPFLRYMQLPLKIADYFISRFLNKFVFHN